MKNIGNILIHHAHIDQIRSQNRDKKFKTAFNQYQDHADTHILPVRSHKF